MSRPKSKEMDLTVGNPFWSLLKFAIPVILGNLFQLFYTLADSVIVGKTLGADSLAAVGATSIIIYFVFCFINGFTGGFGICLGQRCGAKDEKGMRKSVAVSTLLSIIFTIVLTLICCLLAHQILRWMQIPEDISGEAYDYMFVVLLGTGATVFYNMISNMLRALGDSKTPLVFLIIASIINIILDFVFILTFKMGVAGAGWATVIAQFISGILCFVYSLKKFPILRLTKHDWKFSWKFAWQHLEVGLPMAFQFSITAIGTMVIQSALNSLGSTAVAAFTAGSKIDQFATQPLASLGVAVATYTAQNYGARELERIKKGVTGAAIIATVCGIVGGFVVITFAKPLVALFVGSGQNEVMSLSKEYLVLNGVFYVILGLLFVYRNALQGIGSSMIAFFGGVWELVMRSLVAFVLVSYLKFAAVCIASPVAWFGATIWLMIAYFIIINRIIKKANFAKINY